MFGLNWVGALGLDSVPRETQEIIDDLSKFATIRSSGADEDSEETAYAELVEYVRVGVMLISEELYSSGPAANAEATIH